MNLYPFSIFKRADRSCYSVSFKDSHGKYLRPLSTGKKTKTDAMKAAFQMLREGIAQHHTTASMQHVLLKDTIRRIKSNTEAELMMSELKRLGWVKTFILNDAPAAEDFVSFLHTFWNWDTSPYIKEKLRKCHSIHKLHCIKQGQAITQYWLSFLKADV